MAAAFAAGASMASAAESIATTPASQAASSTPASLPASQPLPSRVPGKADEKVSIDVMSLSVHTSVSYGNACDIVVRRGPEGATVEFAADPHGGPESLWFCFRLQDDRDTAAPLGRIRLVLKHLENMLGGKSAEKIWPVVRLAQGDWQRLPAGTAEPLPDGRCCATWLLDVPAPHVDVAVCYPYGRPEIDALVRDTGRYWRVDTIGVSQGARPLVRLSNDVGQPGGDRPGLYLMARQHSGETPGSWVLDGFLRHLAAFGDKAPLVWCVPLTNIDGVEQGDYGKDNFPYDLNRAWGAPSMRHEVLVFQGDIQRWRRRCRPVLALDFHAPGLCENDGSYLYPPNPREHPALSEAGRSWVDDMARFLGSEYASANFCHVRNYPSRWETPSLTSYFAGIEVLALSLETPYGASKGKILTCEDYQQIGRRLSQCVTERLMA